MIYNQLLYILFSGLMMIAIIENIYQKTNYCVLKSFSKNVKIAKNIQMYLHDFLLDLLCLYLINMWILEKDFSSQ